MTEDIAQMAPDLMLGLAGSLVVGAAVWLAGGGLGMLATFMVGYAGAALAIIAQRTVWRSAWLGT